ncbi:lipid-A-disaccharide synthase N-terminal domain-containing protein [Tabrizicola sp.]|uniref:lipid-A-disaccharide synthase N-terminal domain-containing protein n=1 Tax=Tabrizicola sp. TaxID=2005166 RepID=UPI003F3953CC
MREVLWSALHVQSWAEFYWVMIGLTGQLLFTARFLVQWIASEREKRSVIPIAFWYFSLGGGLVLFSYAVWRMDPVFILGQSMGLVIYTRNLWLIHAEQHRDPSVARN